VALRYWTVLTRAPETGRHTNCVATERPRSAVVIFTRLGKELSVSQHTGIDDREAEASARVAKVFDTAVLEHALETKMTHELGYGSGDLAGAGQGVPRTAIQGRLFRHRMGPGRPEHAMGS
jgi:hypothetical protein